MVTEEAVQCQRCHGELVWTKAVVGYVWMHADDTNDDHEVLVPWAQPDPE